MSEDTELAELRRWNTAHCNDWVRLQEAFGIEFDAPEAMIEAVKIKHSNETFTLRARLALLESVLAEAGEALEPFKREYETFDCAQGLCEMLPDDHRLGAVGEWPPHHTPMEAAYTFGDLRRAASVSNQIAGMKEKSE